MLKGRMSDVVMPKGRISEDTTFWHFYPYQYTTLLPPSVIT